MYKITTSQLIVAWIFGVLALAWALDARVSAEELTLIEFTIWFVPFALIFYTLGWWKRHDR